ncbi:hypothetical protein Tco_0743443 [Tanacetum coccineum]
MIRKLLEDVQNISEELAEYINSPSWNRPAFYFDDDDDEESSIPVRDIISKLPLCVAITPDLPITDSLIMGDEHLSTNPKTKSALPVSLSSINCKGDDNSTSLSEFESFHVDYPYSGDSTIDVLEDIPVDVPNILPTHSTLHMDFDFIPSHNDLRSDLNVSYQDRNKIYDLEICIEVKSTRFLATYSPVIDTLLPFSSENKNKVFNHGVLASKVKSPPSSSHRGFKASELFHHKSPMIAPDYEASRARGFIFRSLELQSFA